MHTAALLAAAIFAFLASFPAPAGAHDAHDVVLEEVGVDERHGAKVPADLAFTDASGKAVRLGDYLGGGPAILTLNYYTCPMLCPLTFRNLAASMAAVKGLSVSKDYRVVTASINPEEDPGVARARASETHGFVPELVNPDDRWPFLYGSADSVRRLTDAVGFRYRKVGSEYAHATVAIVLTPGGAVSRYLYGVEIPPRDLKLALIEAAGGKIGESSAGNALLMYCFQYDPVGKRYALVAMNIMKLAGAVTVVFLGGLLAFLWLRRGKDDGGRGTGK